MWNKLIVIGLTFFIVLLASSSPALAKGYSKYWGNSHSPKNTSIQYDEPDEGDNLHPSGKDRSIEHGRSGTQGKSDSDPDENGKGPDRSNGGLDKQLHGSGGVDREDQDNNNGCGNDDDFEDDNEGWCGQKPKDVSHPHDGDEVEKSPKAKEGKVLGATSLPITGPTDNSYVFVMLSLLAGGSLLYIVSRRLEKI
ncbi:MAG: hypothetical protein A2Z42_00805 [Candidatus Woykebacteria bacterium RBG_19FT_COMBO_43_10]|uniref:Gram-positive cocci surface proteins LPxTG domain-containing protein n=1 Tax=Candidatus Woykebacteria bacterium RBG_19FT_COMBO_43_10 TaxID=1802598 RepID=A0A1G1WI65_9BACT|nr:MAG: hypothetical protein A2Z42_00805 [Candidatus Woykebacteria bacterium RBG_19FT_COMBO_43_10]